MKIDRQREMEKKNKGHEDRYIERERDGDGEEEKGT